MGTRPLAEPLTELPQWIRPAHQFDFPIWETQTKQQVRLPHQLGYPRKFVDGSEWYLAKNGGTILQPGYYVETVITAIAETDITKPIEIADSRVTFEVPAGTTVSKDQFEGGYYMVKDGTGKGLNMPIKGNTASPDGATAAHTINIYLGVQCPVDLDTTTDVQIVTSPWNNMRLGSGPSAGGNAIARGIPPIVIPANEYFWIQGRGPGLAFSQTAKTLNNESVALRPGTGGQLIAANPTADATDGGQPVVAHLLDPAAVAAGEAIYVDMFFV